MEAVAILIFTLILSFVQESPTNAFKESMDPKIIGGIPATRGEFPWIIQIQIGSSIGRHHCGGVLISADHVITTAFCASPSQSYTVIAGEHNLNSDEGSEQSRLVSEIVRHPKADVAILKLAAPFTLNLYVRAAILPSTGEEVFGNLTVAGWGSTVTGGVYPDVLHKVDVSYVDRESCDESYPIGIEESEICAGSEGKGFCDGDPGSPLQNHNGIVYGIATWAIGCAAPGYPGIYPSFSYLAGWINENV